jgi:colanic acid biosynthesis glycosyl transferase WcaI
MIDRKQPRLLVIAINFAPELTGIGKYVGDMTTRLHEAGIAVRVITAPPYYPAWSVQTGYSAHRYAKERLAGAEVYRCPLVVPHHPSGFSRLVHLGSFALTALPVMLWQAITWRPQTIFVVEPPLACAPGALLAGWLCGARCWLHVQDLEVDAAFELGLLRAAWLRRAALFVERWLLRRFERITSISQGMQARLRGKGVDPAHMGYFPNWVDTKLIHPLQGSNRLRAALGIADDTPVLLYAGNMGEKQGLDLIVDVARSLVGARKALFLLCGDGAARSRLETAAVSLTNVRFIPLQPSETFNELLNLADVHLLPQRAGAEDLVMPSKLCAMMASGRPVIACARAGSDVDLATREGGLVVAPGDPVAFVAAISRLLDDRELCQELGRSGRAFALCNWDREVVLQRALPEFLNSIDTAAG